MKNFFYRVCENDTVFSVCEKFSVPIGKLIKDNSLTMEISAGDILFIEQSSVKTYKVKPNDTISSISKQFNVCEDLILSFNAVDYIFYGLILFIP